MGYNTDFEGVLKFTNELTTTQLGYLASFLNEDCRDHLEWGMPNLTYIDLMVTKDYSGLQWSGAEKSYDMVEKVNFIISKMKERWPDFGLEGLIRAQGESLDDRWHLVINKHGFAERRDVIIKGKKVQCPHCDEDFFIEFEE